VGFLFASPSLASRSIQDLAVKWAAVEMLTILILGVRQAWRPKSLVSFAALRLVPAFLSTQGLRLFGFAQGRLWAAFFRRFAAGVR
jgi:hypothetical protein